MKRCTCCILVLIASTRLFAAAPVDPANPPEGTFVDEWYTVRMDKARVGHMHSTLHRDGNHITTSTEMALTISRGETKLKVEMNQTTRELLDGTPVGFDSTMTMGMAPMRTVGRIRNGVLKLRDEQFGKKTTRELPFDMSGRLGWGVYIEQYKHGFKPGTKYEVKTYDSSLRPDAPFITRINVVGPDVMDIAGKKVRATKVIQTIVMPQEAKPAAGDKAAPAGGMGAAAAQLLGGELESTAWVDDDGQIVRMDTSIGGMFHIQMDRSTKSEALAEVEETAEMFLSTLIPVKQRVRPQEREIVYRVSMKEDAPLPELPTTGMQSFKRIDKTTGILTVRRIDWSHVKGKLLQSPPAAQDVYLKATLLADADNPKIRELAQRAVGQEKDAAACADKLRRFVSDYVVNKNMSVGFASASEVAQSRSGDCSEHAVLLAAMCRSAGLPSRGVAGIVMVPGSRPAKFGYHMWTEVRIDGKWVAIDAALEQTECDPTHIALALLDLGDSGLADAGFKLLPVIGRLELNIEAGRPSR